MNILDIDDQIFEDSQGAQAAPQAVAEAIQQSTMSGSMEPVRPEGWVYDDAPIAIRFPKEYDPNNPQHKKAYEYARQEAYDPTKLGSATLQYIQDVENQAKGVVPAQKAVAESLAEISRIKSQLKSGVVQLPSVASLGMAAPPSSIKLNQKDRAKLNIQLGTAENKLKANEEALNKSMAPVSPTFIDVKLPKPQEPVVPQQQPEQQGKIPTRAEAEEGEGAFKLPEVTSQEKKFKLFKRSLDEWRAQNLANPRVDRLRIKDMYDAELERAASMWDEEVRVIGSKLQTRDSPTTGWKEVQDVGVVSRELFNKSFGHTVETLKGVEQINRMAILADEAATTKNPQERAAKIAALKNGLKAAQSAIVGTSDAIQNAEFKRYADALERYNPAAILQGEDTLAKFFTTNPEGFAKQMRELRSIVAERIRPDIEVMQQLRKQNKTLPLAPEIPSYIREQFGQPKTREELLGEMNAAPSKPQPTTITSGGSKIRINR